jgi:hypothetical protein
MRLLDGDAHRSDGTNPPEMPQIAVIAGDVVDYDLNFSICAIKKRATEMRAKTVNKINVR